MLKSMIISFVSTGQTRTLFAVKENAEAGALTEASSSFATVVCSVVGTVAEVLLLFVAEEVSPEGFSVLLSVLSAALSEEVVVSFITFAAAF